MRKTNIREIKVKTVMRPSGVGRLPQQRIATHPDENGMAETVVSVEKYLNGFKSEKSQSRSERSHDSHGSSNGQRQGGLAYESFTNRYYNNSSLVKKLTDSNGNGRRPDFPVQGFKINVATSHQQQQSKQESNRSLDRFEKTTTIEATMSSNAALGSILTVIDKFDRESANSTFEEYIERVAALNDGLSSITKQMQGRNQSKQIIDRFKHILNSLSRRCLLRLSEKEDEYEAATQQNLRTTSQLVIEQMKCRYEKKISKLMQTIQEKQQKEHEVNRLLYCLRKNGVDIEEIWNRSLKEEKRHKKCRTEYH